jgi:mRNA-degrading endonuclease toxin of MazEF toxin-antitoxin module
LPADLDELTRGAVCLALYPFTFGFPLEQLQRESEDSLLAEVQTVEDIEQIERTISAGDVPEVVTKVKLRRVLLLQTGTEGRIQDVVVARITSVSETMRSRAGFYRRLSTGTHPTSLLLGARPEHGTNGRESYVNLINVSPIAKTAILRRVGQLSDSEMRQVTDRLLTSLELDISHRINPAS